MRPFQWLYDWVLSWAGHRHAPWALGGLSFAESSFFPIPPDVLLAPMTLARPDRAWYFAALTTITSVLGGLFGYLIGYYAIELVEPLIRDLGREAAYQQARTWFSDWGFWIVFVAGFSPIPYKVFTIAAGALGIFWLPFLLASLVGRGARFFLVAGLLRWGGPGFEAGLRRYVDALGWLCVVLVVGLIGYLQL